MSFADNFGAVATATKFQICVHSGSLQIREYNLKLNCAEYSKTCLKRPLKKKIKNWFSRPINT